MRDGGPAGALQLLPRGSLPTRGSGPRLEVGGHALIGHEGSGRVLIRAVARIQDDVDAHTSFMGIEERLRSAPR